MLKACRCFLPLAKILQWGDSMNTAQDEVRDPRQVWARRTWVADKGFRRKRPEFRYGPGGTDLGHHGSDRTDPRPTLGQTEKIQYMGQTEQTQGQHWARPNRPKTNTGPDQKDSVPGPDRTDPRPTLGQTVQTQDQHWVRPKRLST